MAFDFDELPRDAQKAFFAKLNAARGARGGRRGKVSSAEIQRAGETYEKEVKERKRRAAVDAWVEERRKYDTWPDLAMVNAVKKVLGTPEKDENGDGDPDELVGSGGKEDVSYGGVLGPESEETTAAGTEDPQDVSSVPEPPELTWLEKIQLLFEHMDAVLRERLAELDQLRIPLPGENRPGVPDTFRDFKRLRPIKSPPTVYETLNAIQGSVLGHESEAAGQKHHAISRKVFDALQRHKILRNHYRPRDRRLVVRAKDLPSHKGYQQWHREIDREVATWVDDNPDATPIQFEKYLHERYNKRDLRDRFPGRLGR